MRTTSHKSSSLLWLILAVLVIALVLVFRHGAAGLLMRVAAPVLGVRDSLAASEVATLKAELASTTAALAASRAAAAEDEALRAEFGRAHGAPEVAAGVLERPPGTPYDTFVIDAGTAQGIAVGDPVLVGGVAVGVVDTVYDITARVTLYSSPGEQYQALIETKNGSVPVGVIGQGGGSMQALVPQGTAVAIGDSAVLPGIAGNLVAQVSAIDAAPDGTSQTIYLHLPFNLFDAQYVFVEIK